MAQFGVISYALVGVLYASLCILLVTNWRGRTVAGYLIVACVVSVFWALSLAIQFAQQSMPVVSLFSLDAIRSGTWILFVTSLLANLGAGKPVRYLPNMIWLLVLAAAVGWWIFKNSFGTSFELANIAVVGGSMIALTGLMLVEQLYRNSPLPVRRDVKYLVLGLGGLFVYDLFVFTQGPVFASPESAAWAARGAVNILFIPFIVATIRRNPDWELNIFVSRQVVFYSTTALGVIAYLLLVVLGEFVLSQFGGAWASAARVVFLVGATLLFVLLLLSSSVRAKAKVFFSKHFFRNKYDYREEWLRLISTIAAFEDSSTRQIVVKAMAQIVDSAGGLLWSLDEHGREFRLVATYNESVEAPNIDVDSSLAAFIRHEGWLVDLDEYQRNPALYGELNIPDWISSDPRYWLIVPLMFQQQLIGLVMLYKAPGPPTLNYEDRDLLKTVGSHLAVHLAQENADSLLAEAQQFEAYNRLTAFLMHDLNNLIAQQSLIIRNAEKHRRNPEFVDDAIHTISNSVERMRRVMDQLKQGEAESEVKPTELRSIIAAAINRCAGNAPEPVFCSENLDISIATDPDQLSMVLTHLVQNAQDATPSDGEISVAAKRANAGVVISIEDSGCGMSAEYVRDQLFRPFESTKGSQGMGIGAYQAREFARKMGGDLTVVSSIGDGTTVTMTLPIGRRDSFTDQLE